MLTEFKVYLRDENDRPYRLTELPAKDRESAPIAAVEWMRNAFGARGGEEYTIDCVVQTGDH